MSSPGWSIRSARHADLDEVLSLWSQAEIARGPSDNPQDLGSLLAEDPDALLIAESEGAMIGSLIACWNGWRGSFYRLAVRPDRRREGVASALVREGEQRLAEMGAKRLTAIVADDEPLAAGFWRAAGYVPQPGRVRFLRHV